MAKNERKLAKNQDSVDCESVDDDAYRDRGYTRPKVNSPAFMPYNYGTEMLLGCPLIPSLCMENCCFNSLAN